MPKTLEQLKAEAATAANALAAAQKQADAEAAAAAAPRTPDVILADLLEQLVMQLGNKLKLRVLIAEFKGATKQTVT